MDFSPSEFIAAQGASYAPSNISNHQPIALSSENYYGSFCDPTWQHENNTRLQTLTINPVLLNNSNNQVDNSGPLTNNHQTSNTVGDQHRSLSINSETAIYPPPMNNDKGISPALLIKNNQTSNTVGCINPALLIKNNQTNNTVECINHDPTTHSSAAFKPPTVYKGPDPGWTGGDDVDGDDTDNEDWWSAGIEALRAANKNLHPEKCKDKSGKLITIRDEPRHLIHADAESDRARRPYHTASEVDRIVNYTTWNGLQGDYNKNAKPPIKTFRERRFGPHPDHNPISSSIEEVLDPLVSTNSTLPPSSSLPGGNGNAHHTKVENSHTKAPAETKNAPTHINGNNGHERNAARVAQGKKPRGRPRKNIA